VIGHLFNRRRRRQLAIDAARLDSEHWVVRPQVLRKTPEVEHIAPCAMDAEEGLSRPALADLDKWRPAGSAIWAAQSSASRNHEPSALVDRIAQRPHAPPRRAAN
jgi:hypothetical protein